MFFSFIPCFSHNSLTLKLFVWSCFFDFACIFFWLCLTIARCYHFVDYVTLHCHNALLLSLYFATCPTLLLHLIVAPPCYYYELHLATATSSTLPLLFYHYCCYAWLFALLRCCSTLLLLHLCYFSACFKYQWPHLKLLLLPYLIVVSPYYCFALLILFASCVSLASTSTLPYFLVGFGFWRLKKQTTTN